MPFNINIYNVNWNKLISWLLPLELFKTKFIVLVKSITAPISMLHNDLLVYRKAKLAELALTPQIGSMVYYLNKRYDATDNRIYITNGMRGTDNFIFLETEVETDYLFDDTSTEQMHIYTDSEVGATPAHFIVWLPIVLQPKQLEIEAIINKLKMPSKRFQIQFI